MSRPGDDEKRQFEQADHDRSALDPPVRPGADDRQQGRRGHRQGERTRQAEHLADAGDAGEFGDERADRRRREPRDRNESPSQAVALANELGVAAAGEDAEAHRQLLHQIEHRDQEEDERQQPVAPQRSPLRRDDNIADVGVGQHDQQARAPYGDRPDDGGRAEAARVPAED